MNMTRLMVVAALAVLLSGCTGALQRGMLDSACISTARPAISMQARVLPLLTGGRGGTQLSRTGVMGGLPLNVWVAVYGTGALQSPLAIVALAEVPQGWYWDSDGQRAGSVDAGVEVFDGVGYQASTYVLDSARDPFSTLAGVPAEGGGQSARWLVRGFAARFSFNACKVILEYREPLPPRIALESGLGAARTEDLRAFEQRAREAFTVGPVPARLAGLAAGYAQNVHWQFMDQQFLGTVSKYDVLNTH